MLWVRKVFEMIFEKLLLIECIYMYKSIPACGILNCFQTSLYEARMRRSGVFSLIGLWRPFSFYVLCWLVPHVHYFWLRQLFLILDTSEVAFGLVTPFWSGSSILTLELHTEMLSGYWVVFTFWFIHYILARILFLDIIYDIHIFYRITYVLK